METKEELLEAYVDRPWRNTKADYTVEQLARAVPRAILRWARRRAEAEGRDLIKADLKLRFREPDGTININGIRAALRRLPFVKDVPADVLAQTRAELRRELEKAREALGLEEEEELLEEPFSEKPTWKEELLGEPFPEKLTWTVPLAEAEISELEEDGRRTVKALVTLIRAGWSQNERYYPANVLAKAAHLFERVGSFDGHIKNPKVSDYVGWFENVSFDGGALTANFHVFDEKLARVVAHAPHLVGLSISGEGRVVRGEAEGRKGWLVESIERANSVDVVVSPAAGGGINAILEALTNGQEERMDINTLADLKKAFPDLLEEYRQEIKRVIYSEKEEERNKAKLAEAEKLQEELEVLKREKEELERKVRVFESRELLERKLAEAELPDVAKERIRALFVDRVAEAEDVTRVITAEKEYLERLAEAVPVKGVKPEEDPLLEEHERTLKALRKLWGIEEDER